MQQVSAPLGGTTRRTPTGSFGDGDGTAALARAIGIPARTWE